MIITSDINDVAEIRRLYGRAVDYQKQQGAVPWPEFTHGDIATGIAEKRQWKLLIGDAIACIWTITFNDRQIWEQEDDDAIYIHRIAIDPTFRGRHLVNEIVGWAINYAIASGKKYIRLDTVGENKKLIQHYTASGFSFLGMKKLANTDGLPAHYQQTPVCLFELRVNNNN